MAMTYKIKVSLWVFEDELDSFRRFEDQAFEIMQNYGAVVACVESPVRQSAETPYQIHLLEFPSKMAFDAYRADIRLSSLMGLRSRAIKGTELEVVLDETRPTQHGP